MRSIKDRAIFPLMLIFAVAGCPSSGETRPITFDQRVAILQAGTLHAQAQQENTARDVAHSKKPSGWRETYELTLQRNPEAAPE